jgi:hypothetical protein
MLAGKAPHSASSQGLLLRTDSLFALRNASSPPSATVCQSGVMDHVLHPVELLEARFTVMALFGRDARFHPSWNRHPKTYRTDKSPSLIQINAIGSKL